MNLDPHEYNIRELREAAGANPAQQDLSSATDVDPVTFASVEAELAFAELAGDGPSSRPYLSGVPEGHLAEMIVFQWLEYLAARAGVHGTLKALRYYHELEWINEAALKHLRLYLSELEDPRGTPSGLSTEDHRVSLRFVERLGSLAGG